MRPTANSELPQGSLPPAAIQRFSRLSAPNSAPAIAAGASRSRSERAAARAAPTTQHAGQARGDDQREQQTDPVGEAAYLEPHRIDQLADLPGDEALRRMDREVVLGTQPLVGRQVQHEQSAGTKRARQLSHPGSARSTPGM